MQHGTRAARVAVAVLVAAALAACSDGTGPSGSSQVAIRFGTVATSPAANVVGSSTPASSPVRGFGDLVAATPVTVSGSNGTLEISDVRLVVNRFELEQADSACSTSGEEMDCEEFNAPPSFVDVPLDGTSQLVVSEPVPEGTWVKMQFKVENLQEDSEADAGEAPQLSTLLTQIRTEFPDWPQNASMLVEGTFTPTGGQPQAFRVYFQAEIEIERALQPPLVVGPNAPAQDITVNVDPSVWFTASDGTVLDLSQWDYDSTGQVVEFESEMEHGFVEVQHEDHVG